MALVRDLVDLRGDVECRVFELMTQIMLRHGAHCNNCGPHLLGALQQAGQCAEEEVGCCVAFGTGMLLREKTTFCLTLSK